MRKAPMSEANADTTTRRNAAKNKVEQAAELVADDSDAAFEKLSDAMTELQKAAANADPLSDNRDMIRDEATQARCLRRATKRFSLGTSEGITTEQLEIRFNDFATELGA